MEFKVWLESSYKDLHTSTVEAFPKTTKRQNIVNTVKIKEVKTIPYLGVRTFFAKGITENNHKPIILFKNVEFIDEKPTNLSLDGEVIVRCSCEDFHWRFNYFDYKDKSLYGSVRKKYEAKHNPGSANPHKLPGMCKHIMKLMDEIENGSNL